MASCSAQTSVKNLTCQRKYHSWVQAYQAISTVIKLTDAKSIESEAPALDCACSGLNRHTAMLQHARSAGQCRQCQISVTSSEKACNVCFGSFLCYRYKLFVSNGSYPKCRGSDNGQCCNNSYGSLGNIQYGFHLINFLSYKQLAKCCICDKLLEARIVPELQPSVYFEYLNMHGLSACYYLRKPLI